METTATKYPSLEKLSHLLCDHTVEVVMERNYISFELLGRDHLPYARDTMDPEDPRALGLAWSNWAMRQLDECLMWDNAVRADPVLGHGRDPSRKHTWLRVDGRWTADVKHVEWIVDHEDCQCDEMDAHSEACASGKRQRAAEIWETLKGVNKELEAMHVAITSV